MACYGHSFEKAKEIYHPPCGNCSDLTVRGNILYNSKQHRKGIHFNNLKQGLISKGCDGISPLIKGKAGWISEDEVEILNVKFRVFLLCSK
jgi:hypothetical protein